MVAGEGRGQPPLFKQYGNHAVINREMITQIARNVVRDIGYDQEGFSYHGADVEVLLHGQSPDIAMGVDARKKKGEDQEGKHAADASQSPAAEERRQQSCKQQENHEVERLDEEPEDLGKIIEHPSPLFRCGTTLPPLLRLEPAGRPFDDMRCLEQRFLVERPTDELQAERQALAVQTGRHRNPRQAGTLTC